MDFKLIINNKGSIQDATDLCEGEIKLTSQRRGSPAKLECRIVRDGKINFHEGNQISLTVDNIGMFSGYVFKKQRNSDQIISVTAYDQIRYLKNKDTIVYTNKKANEVISMLAADYGLNVGGIADTGYVIPKRCEDTQTLMDIFYNALDLTVIHMGIVHVLYDDFGSLTLKKLDDMKLNKVISSEGQIIDFDYSTDIDTSTYNKIKLYKDNKDTGKREVFIEMDSGNTKNWGILQLTEKVDEELDAGQIIQRARQLLKNHNKVNRTLSIDNMIGDPAIRAGNSLFIEIPDLGDISLKQLLVIDKCVHTLKNNEHTMRFDMYSW